MIMRKIVLSIFLLLSAVVYSQNNYKIKCDIFEGTILCDTLYLITNLETIPTVESMAVVGNGSYTFVGKVSASKFSNIVSVESGNIKHYGELYLEPGDINVKIGELRQTVSGTFLNDRLQQYKDSVAPIIAIYEQYAAKCTRENISQAALDEAQKVMIVTTMVRIDIAEKYIRKNYDNPVALYIMERNYQLFPPEKGRQLLSLLPEELQNTPLAIKLKTFYSSSGN